VIEVRGAPVSFACLTADRRRSVKFRLLEIGRAARSKGGGGKEKLQQAYRKLMAATSRVLGQAKRFSREIGTGVKLSRDIFATSSGKPPSKVCARNWIRWRRESGR